MYYFTNLYKNCESVIISVIVSLAGFVNTCNVRGFLVVTKVTVFTLYMIITSIQLYINLAVLVIMILFHGHSDTKKKS